MMPIEGGLDKLVEMKVRPSHRFMSPPIGTAFGTH